MPSGRVLAACHRLSRLLSGSGERHQYALRALIQSHFDQIRPIVLHAHEGQGGRIPEHPQDMAQAFDIEGRMFLVDDNPVETDPCHHDGDRGVVGG